jgi:hypothetical protein
LEKCVGCQYYDRDDSHAIERGVRWGKCRRSGPMIHPTSAKSYMVEGVWPHVRDDDWCGEWTASKWVRQEGVGSIAVGSLMQPAFPSSRPPGPVVPLTSPDASGDAVAPISTLMRGHVGSD